MAALARLGLLSTIFLFVSANNVYHLPARTVRTDDGYAVSGWTPKPTEKPSQKELFKRQTNGLQAGFPSSICGYVTSDTNNPLFCTEGNYCGVATELGFYGCCLTYYPTTLGNTVSYLLSGCSYFQTRCWDSTASDASAQYNTSNYLEFWCTDAAYPYCQTLTSFNANMTWLDCWTAPGIFNVSNPIPAASMPVIPDVVITSAEVSWVSAVANKSAPVTAPGTVVGTYSGSSISTRPMSTGPVSTSSVALTPISTSGAATSKSSASSNFRIQSFGGGIGMVAGVLLSIAWVLMCR